MSNHAKGVKESVNVLLESVPEGMEMETVERTIDAVAGVLAVHDLHVWAVGSGMICCICHITVEEQSVRSGENVLRAVAEELERKFEITHSTIQVEVEGCDPHDMYCIMQVARRAAGKSHELNDKGRSNTTVATTSRFGVKSSPSV